MLAIVLHALGRLAGRALQGRTETIIALAAFLALFAFQVPFPLVVIAAGAAGLAGAGRPRAHAAVAYVAQQAVEH